VFQVGLTDVALISFPWLCLGRRKKDFWRQLVCVFHQRFISQKSGGTSRIHTQLSFILMNKTFFVHYACVKRKCPVWFYFLRQSLTCPVRVSPEGWKGSSVPTPLFSLCQHAGDSSFSLAAHLLSPATHFSVANSMLSSPKAMFPISLTDLIMLFPDLSTPLFFPSCWQSKQMKAKRHFQLQKPFQKNGILT